MTYFLTALPVLEVLQLGVDLLCVEVGPQDVLVGGHAVGDRRVQGVQLGQQRQLLPDSLQLGVLWGSHTHTHTHAHAHTHTHSCAHTFTFRAFSRRFCPKRLTMTTFVSRK